jgi:predicted metal-binding protein
MIRYVVALQCHIVKERCSGYLCELAFQERSGGFTNYADQDQIRFLPMTCGGCCGRATLRKLSNLIKMLKKKEGVEKDRITVHLASCVCKDNYHAPPCPHQSYLEELIRDKLSLTLAYGTRISKTAEKRRADGLYKE